MDLIVESVATNRYGERTLTVRARWLRVVGQDTVEPMDESMELPAVDSLADAKPGDELMIVPKGNG